MTDTTDRTTAQALVAVERPESDADLLERARAFAAGADRRVVVVALATPDEFEELSATLETIGRTEHTSYTASDAEAGIAGDAADAAAAVFGDAVDYGVRVAVAPEAEQAETLVDIADEVGADHVFVRGARRSPTGKAVFGDRTQELLLNFDGFVTVTTVEA
ncbi:universal stress protein [Halobaculum litoreum]|uniref:Universal stress protein n=1 Tax=Halobaculum litoreum TaxID=3031998 RepID=A0ABD5XTM3_9EURY